MKNFFASMAGRVFLILVTGIVASAALTLVLAGGERQEMMVRMRNVHTAERVSQLVLALEAAPAEARPGLAAASRRGGIQVKFEAAVAGDSAEPDPDFTLALRQQLGDERKIIALRAGDADCRPPPRSSIGAMRNRPMLCRTVYLNLQDGTPIHFTLARPRDFPSPPFGLNTLPYLLLFLVCISVLAYLVARMATRPLRQLEQAAIELGRDIGQEPLPERGPTEVANAARAFNAMQARIHKHIQERTRILAAITHDLQTPLTRLRLRLEKVPDDTLREKLIADLSATQDMVREGLDLARSMDSAEKPQPLDLDSLLDSVCADAADAGQNVTLAGKIGASVMARPGALKRCLTNLLDNAVKYGGAAQVSASREGAQAVIRLRDHGPGIPEAYLETVFEPFYRMETSRSRETGGTGLGLPIARNIAEKHGGTLRLRNHPSGGLEAILALPLEKAVRPGRL